MADAIRPMRPDDPSKCELRRQIKLQLSAISPDSRRSDSESACKLLERQAVWQQARRILFYAPMADELDVWPLLRDALAAKKLVALPRFDSAAQHYFACRISELPADIADGKFGIREPAEHCSKIELKEIDLILVPGLGFDKSGRRLGRGKGFYDRLLAEARTTTCGVGFDEQLIAEVPIEAHDVQLGYILTPTRWIKCSGAV